MRQGANLLPRRFEGATDRTGQLIELVPIGKLVSGFHFLLRFRAFLDQTRALILIQVNLSFI
jgi:hypothetical protein